MDLQNPHTQVQILLAPQLAEMAELAMHFLAKEDHAGSSPVLRSTFSCTIGLVVGHWSSKPDTRVQFSHGAQIGP